jgi:hypothetical protein
MFRQISVVGYYRNEGPWAGGILRQDRGDLEEAVALILDPMLATGGACWRHKTLKRGCRALKAFSGGRAGTETGHGPPSGCRYHVAG